LIRCEKAEPEIRRESAAASKVPWSTAATRARRWSEFMRSRVGVVMKDVFRS